MKILYFSGVRLPSTNAASVHVMKMAQAFTKAGHDVTLYAKGKLGATPERLFSAYNIQASFDISLIPFIKIPVYSDGKPLRELKKKMQKKMSGQNPDLIFGRDPLALALFCPHHVPILFEVDALPTSKIMHWAFVKLIRQDNFKGIVTQSDLLKQTLLLCYEELSGEQIFVAHDGADLRNNIAAQERIPELLRGRKDAPKVGYTGSLYLGKGVELIERMAKICPEFDFHVVGGTKRQVHKFRSKRVAPNLYYYGHKNHSEIPAFLKTFDIVVAPYQHQALIRTGEDISRWVSPIKLFEYMAAQRPILCSDLPEIREILTHDRNALLVPAAEEEKWVQAIRFLYNHPEIAARLTAQAYEDLKEKYTWDRRAEAIIDFYYRAEGFGKRFQNNGR